MASGGSPKPKEASKELDVRFYCSLCMEPYRGRTPKLLSCCHTFCLPCLTALEASVTADKTRSPDNDDKGNEESDEKKLTVPTVEEEEGDIGVGPDGTERLSFPCPTCRAPVIVPEGGVACLQTNFYIEHEDEAPPPVLCDMCEIGNQQPANHSCQQCDMALCRVCRRYHDKLMPKHHVTALGLGEPAKEKERKRYCLLHQDQVLCFHCRQCDASVCLHCKLTSHEGHATVDIMVAAQETMKDLPELITAAQQQVQVMDTSLLHLNREDRQLTNLTQEVAQQIQERYNVLVRRAKQTQDQLVEDVTLREATARSQLNAEKSSTSHTRDALSALLARAVSATANDPDVMTVRNDLKAALLDEEHLDLHKQRINRWDPPWCWRYDLTDACGLLLEDAMACMGRVVEGPETGAAELPVSLRALAEIVDSLSKETTDTSNAMASQLAACQNDVAALQKKEADLGKNTSDLEQKVSDLEKKSSDLKQKGIDSEKNCTNLEKQVTRLEKSGADLQKKTDSLTAITETMLQTDTALLEKVGTPLFRAKRLNKTKTKEGKAMIFDTIGTNLGNYYNQDTGQFTAHNTGAYIFRITLESNSLCAVVCAYLIVDDVTQCIVRGNSSGVVKCVILFLKTGQKVWMKASDDVSKYDERERPKGTTFSGFLVNM